MYSKVNHLWYLYIYPMFKSLIHLEFICESQGKEPNIIFFKQMDSRHHLLNSLTFCPWFKGHIFDTTNHHMCRGLFLNFFLFFNWFVCYYPIFHFKLCLHSKPFGYMVDSLPFLIAMCEIAPAPSLPLFFLYFSLKLFLLPDIIHILLIVCVFVLLPSLKPSSFSDRCLFVLFTAGSLEFTS